MPPHKFGSGEYQPTPLRMLPAFMGGKPSGYTCTQCGHLEPALDPFWEDACPVCLREWAKKNLPRMIPTAEAIEQTRALTPTIKVTKIKSNSDATTKIMSLRNG